MESRRIHPAIAFIYQEHNKKPSEKLMAYLAAFQKPRALDEAVFIEGVQQFMALANMNAKEREAFFGSAYGGLHYSNGLAELWNSQTSDSVTGRMLLNKAPMIWNRNVESSLQMLIYKGNQPSVALDKLLQGPSVIDCGMFGQLAIWFGMRYVLGDDAFNYLFGRAPLYLTQSLYQPVSDISEAYLGNPLLPFFKKISEKSSPTGRVMIEYVRNHALYRAKHPGGTSNGQNCVVIDDLYTMFAPSVGENSRLTKSAVNDYLCYKFNSPRDNHDFAELALFCNETLLLDEEMIPGELTYRDFLQREAEKAYQSLQVKSKELADHQQAEKLLKINFNFSKFKRYVQRYQEQVENKGHTDYQPLPQAALLIADSFFQQIPHENKHVSFENLKTETPMQEKLNGIAKHFCDDILNKATSACVIVSGRAGIGKTASAVAAAKELLSRGKKIGWISEVTVSGWAQACDSIEAVLNLKKKIAESLTPDIEVVFLDDDNLTGYAGTVLLAEVYRWYCTYPNKGLYITSNETISFKDCYGIQLNMSYDYPPFPGYHSPQYTNMHVFDQLIAPSLRPTPTMTIKDCDNALKLRALMSAETTDSLGIIVSEDFFETIKEDIREKEWVAGTSEDILDEMRKQLRQTGGCSNIYQTLTREQLKYLREFEAGGVTLFEFDGSSYMVPEFRSVTARVFECTPCEVIVVDLMPDKSYIKGMIVLHDSIMQLCSIVNFAHDQGERRVIFVNKTQFTEEELLSKIEREISLHDRERTMARLNQLLFSPLLAEAIPAEKTIPEEVLKAEIQTRFSKGLSQGKKETNKEATGVSVHQTRHDDGISRAPIAVSAMHQPAQPSTLGLYGAISKGRSRPFAYHQAVLMVSEVSRNPKMKK